MITKEKTFSGRLRNGYIWGSVDGNIYELRKTVCESIKDFEGKKVNMKITIEIEEIEEVKKIEEKEVKKVKPKRDCKYIHKTYLFGP